VTVVTVVSVDSDAGQSVIVEAHLVMVISWVVYTVLVTRVSTAVAVLLPFVTTTKLVKAEGEATLEDVKTGPLVLEGTFEVGVDEDASPELAGTKAEVDDVAEGVRALDEVAVARGLLVIGAVPELVKAVAAAVEMREDRLPGTGTAGDEKGESDIVTGHTVV
jgi:hypothetical protein